MTSYYSVLDKGFVRLVDSMGDDSSIVQAARISYNQGLKNPKEDEALIRYMMRHHHMTPFEMVEFKFHVKMPIFVARQWHRHRTASINEVSGRYTALKDEFYVPEEKDITTQSGSNKQGGSDESLEDSYFLKKGFYLEQQEIYEGYKEKIKTGLRKELARINLPVSLYTEFYWKVNLRNLLHFLGLRMDSHAQYEIREYADKMGLIVNDIVPIAYQCFLDYQFNALTLTVYDLKAIGILRLKLCSLEYSYEDILETLKEVFPTKREFDEFIEKNKRIS